MDPRLEAYAREVLRREAARAALMRPPLTSAVFYWQAEAHFGGVQHPIVDGEPEIVLVTKTSRAVELPFIEAILALQPERLVLRVDDAIEFQGRMHVLRRVGDRLVRMTAAQSEKATATLGNVLVIDLP